MWLETVEFLVM